MQSAAILEKEVKDLRALNVKQKQKRTRSRRQIPHEEGLSVSEALELIEAPIETPIASAPPPPAKTAFTTFTAAHESFTEVWCLWR